MQVCFRYGVICDNLEKQANEQGFTFGDKKDFVEDLRHSYNMGVFHFLTDKQAEIALKKVHAKVIKYLKPLSSEV
jgi:hypothetical protein